MSERLHPPGFDDGNDENLRQLLREVGARDLPSADVMHEVRSAVHGEWQAVVAQRRTRTRVIRFGIAASIAVAVLAITFALRFATGPGAPVASLARVDGALQIAVDSGDHWRTAAVGEPLPKGAMLRTDEGTRAALDFGDGLSLRIAAGSLVELKSRDRVSLDGGAVYVDAAPSMQPANDRSLVVETLYGSIRHLGTQYEARAAHNRIEVSVREGQVEIVNAGQTFNGSAGEQLLIAGTGGPERRTISPQDPRWQWATDIAPVFDIERHPLSQFLAWVSRETGKRIVYASPEARVRAEQLILRGSVQNLPPEQALNAVLATTPFKHQNNGAEIRIEL
jgi:ferric-dicitrate binding protein FerR (iron transport regulator)